MQRKTAVQRIRERARRCEPPEPEAIGLAAMLCFLDAEPDERIARRLGISRRTLARWKRRPEFDAAYEAVHALYRLQCDAARGLGGGGLIPAKARRTVLP